ncbi:MAG: chemotaxis protein CheW, partial [Deltaproteobacteria bacterium]|nr:chemotaxis protein CheW [Deltaproteobacteria bacterium]
ILEPGVRPKSQEQPAVGPAAPDPEPSPVNPELISSHPDQAQADVFDEGVLSELVAECSEHLGAIEPDLLTMKQDGAKVSPEIIHGVFRAIHNIKGSAGFLGFEALAQLSQAMVSALANFQDRQLTPDSDTVDALQAGADKIRLMLKDVRGSHLVPYEDILQRLKGNLPGDQPVQAKVKTEPSASQSGRDAARPTTAGPDSAAPVADLQEVSVALADLLDQSSAVEVAKVVEISKDSIIPTSVPANVPSRRKEEKPPKEGKQISPETIRVSVGLIDRLMNLAGELVLGRNQLRQELGEITQNNPKLGTIMQNVDLVTSELQENILQIRMQPVGNLLNKFPRIVRDISRQLSKEAELLIDGGEVELDRSILEGLSDPLTHLIRNCLDHGIEDPETRRAQGKPAAGRIQIKADHEGGQVNMVISDDGRGINADKLVQKALTTGIITADRARKLNDKERIDLIFHPGLSTAEVVTDISGRGVGMDVVKTNIEKLGGHLDIDSVLGRGTTVRIRLPLTLAIIPCLIVGSAGYRFAIPQGNVQELVCVPANEAFNSIEQVGNADVLRLRELLLPLVQLTEVLSLQRTFVHPKTGEVMIDRRVRVADRRWEDKRESPDPDQSHTGLFVNRRRSRTQRRVFCNDINVVVLRLGWRSFGLMVDELFDNQEIVVKPLSDHIKSCQCFAGATIMGDGRVAMILDAAGLAEFTRLRFAEIDEENRRRREAEALKAGFAAHGRSVLVFNNAYDEYFALPLEAIARLESIDRRTIQRIRDRSFVDYRGAGLPLILLEKLLPVSPFPPDAEESYVIIPKTPGPPAGILVSRILDTVETQVMVRKDQDTPRGLFGSAFVDGQLTMFLNPDELLEAFSETARTNSLHGGTTER